MSASFWVVTALVVLLVLVLLVAFWAYSTARRLDRLHVRSDRSWQSLESALARRSVVTRAVAAALDAPGSVESRTLTQLADRAERAKRADRERAENAVSVALGRVDLARLNPQMISELADAEARVQIARRFHNDAVRDTLALRSRRPVRLLRLGGTAPMPTYFEITESETADDDVDSASTRTSARVVLLDGRGRVLLLRGHDPAVPDVHFWFTIGGGVEVGETLRDAAVRELQEETGLIASAEDLRGPMWRRTATFAFDGVVIRSEELFFALRAEAFEPVRTGFTELERRVVTGHRWCTSDDIRALASSGDAVYPRAMAELLDEADTVLALRTDPDVRAIH
ncbi:exopolyphosphatase [Rhodococcus sp. Leaf7]|uniref:NUDIX hydrolase n=1 Tax=unclassified Rhodococcus (in: high G+C Gram-positive bacteria) TaxID=192944 RepID=UPI0006F995B3|nr:MULTISPECIES: NUDIX domain-containing protein [unclassified Rhodococcus (in: high G+C Gram-positive bacteria)]KQU02936.1 exopolyphosphatase [Rhodococcus sp. Leaf7]KQU38735.1 exopolyphosphatase [Rhodococcus sp. Leaf247]